MQHIPFIAMLLFMLCPLRAESAGRTIVADAAERRPLPHASVFDRHGRFIGACSAEGMVPAVSPVDYPLTVRYIGFREATVESTATDTVLLREIVMELPEVVVESRRHNMLHMLAYVREYSTLTTYVDTIFMFREKMVDYMLPATAGMRFKGWRKPRVLSSRSYYRFTNAQGLDSVSDRCRHYFSWSDWVGIVPGAEIPQSIRGAVIAADTVCGKYSPTEIWARNADRLRLDVNVLADTASRKWVPNLGAFFRDNLDFEQFRIQFRYDNAIAMGATLDPVDLNGYSYTIESNGRGHGMFLLNRPEMPFFVSTYAEVYMLDKEYITVREARRMERMPKGTSDIAIIEPHDAPPLQPYVLALIDRVNSVDHDGVRIALQPDERLIGRHIRQQNIGERALSLLKTITGISRIRANHNMNRRWKQFRREQTERNQSSSSPPPSAL